MRTLVIGFGNRDRGDDGVGPAVVQRLREVDAVSVDDPLDALDRLHGYDRVVFVDAMRSGREPGTILWVRNPRDLPRDVTCVSSTHAFGPIEVLRLAEVLDAEPPRLELVGIEAGSLQVGTAMSPPVVEASRAVAEELDHA